MTPDEPDRRKSSNFDSEKHKESLKKPIGINQTLKDSMSFNESADAEALIDDHHESILRKRSGKDENSFCLNFELIEVFYSFNIFYAVKHLTKTRAKPWDNRELDALEGIKYISFIFACLA